MVFLNAVLRLLALVRPVARACLGLGILFSFGAFLWQELLFQLICQGPQAQVSHPAVFLVRMQVRCCEPVPPQIVEVSSQWSAGSRARMLEQRTSSEDSWLEQAPGRVQFGLCQRRIPDSRAVGMHLA